MAPLLTLLIIITTGFKKEPDAAAPPPKPAPSVRPAAPAAAEKPPPAELMEDELNEIIANESAFEPYRGAFGPPGEHLLVLAHSDDGTGVDAIVTLGTAPKRVLRLGSIQIHKDQVTGIGFVRACQADGDPALEVCIQYSADPLGSTREDPYTVTVFFDWLQGAGKFAPAQAKK